MTSIHFISDFECVNRASLLDWIAQNEASLALNLNALIVSETPFSLDSKHHGTCLLTCDR